MKGKCREHDFLGPSSQKCLGSTEKGSPVSPNGMFQTKNGNWCSISLKASLIPVSGLCGGLITSLINSTKA